MSPLIAELLAGSERAAARLCRAVDDRVDGYRDVLRELYPHTGKAWIVGVTGNPGAGKSTLTDRLIQAFRKSFEKVAVIAVDPTSPFTGGAILGDRIRMQRHFEDPGVFIRSIATRGALGGLSRSAMDVSRVLDAWGAKVIVVETVGVGQDELEVTRQAHSTVVVVAPGLGDDVQANKAGLLECADVFAVNKADRPGADAAVRDLENMLALGKLSLVAPGRASRGHAGASMRAPSARVGDEQTWTPPIFKTVSTDNRGIEDLVSALAAHRSWLETTPVGERVRLQRAHDQLVSSLRDEVVGALSSGFDESLRAAAARVENREVDPYTACDELIAAFRGGSASELKV